jgi:hypothetical protein
LTKLLSRGKKNSISIVIKNNSEKEPFSAAHRFPIDFTLLRRWAPNQHALNNGTGTVDHGTGSGDFDAPVAGLDTGVRINNGVVLLLVYYTFYGMESLLSSCIKMVFYLCNSGDFDCT